MEKILDKFLRYIAIDTQSDESFTGGKQPSAERELNLSRLLVEELHAMGIANASLDDNGYVMASIPATPGCEKVPAVGFMAHVDTSPDAPGACTNPQIIPNYDGCDIALRGVPGLSLKVSEFPELADYKGQVSPFGYLRINSCLPIPADFRSLPRPSSPVEAKASSVRSLFLRLESCPASLPADRSLN